VDPPGFDSIIGAPNLLSSAVKFNHPSQKERMHTRVEWKITLYSRAVLSLCIVGQLKKTTAPRSARFEYSWPAGCVLAKFISPADRFFVNQEARRRNKLIH